MFSRWSGTHYIRALVCCDFLILALFSSPALGCNHKESSDQPKAKNVEISTEASNQQKANNVEVRTDCPLTEESARQALVKMLEREDAPNFDTRAREVEALRNGENFLIMEKDAEGILSGHWNCDLPAKRFSFITHIGSCLYSCYGVFEADNCRWNAKVTGSSWAMLQRKMGR
jgi:hypothetical protein